MLLILVALFPLFSPTRAQCSVGRVVSCASTWFDGDSDGYITADEIKAYMINKPCGPPNHRFMGTTAIQLCDTDHDGKLSSVDAYDPTMSCLMTNPSVLETACTECDRCDAHGPSKKKKKKKDDYSL